MADGKKNEWSSEHKIKNISVNGTPLESNQDKAEAFAISFSDISSNKNYNNSFLSRKDDIEQNHKNLFANTSTDNGKLNILNEPFAMHELRRALREIKKHSAPGADRISYEMLQKLPKCSIKAVLKLYNQIWVNDDFLSQLATLSSSSGSETWQRCTKSRIIQIYQTLTYSL